MKLCQSMSTESVDSPAERNPLKCRTAGRRRMTKRVVIVHGWDGTPQDGWFPWLQKELEARGFSAAVPQFPNPAKPRIENWVSTLAETVGTPNEQTYFVGHSMGCQAIARYLESLPAGTKVGGAVFVAGFFKHLSGLENDPATRETDRHWLTAPLDLERARKHLPKSIAIFSDDDPWVPLDNQDDFRDKLGSEIVIEHGKGHFSGDRDKTFSAPVVLHKLLLLTTGSSSDGYKK